MEYIKTIKHFPFLKSLEDRAEEFLRDFLLLKKRFKLGVHTSNKSIVGQVRGFSYFLHHKTIPEMIDLGFRHPDWKDEDLLLIQKSFEETLVIPEIAETMQYFKSIKEEAGIISAYFSSMKPDAQFVLHYNNDPYMYRAHLGLIVPEGDLGLQVCNRIVKWQTGKLFIFDTLNPHKAWNLTDKERTVLIVDFYRPEKARSEMQSLEALQFRKRLEQDKASFGFSGGSQQEAITEEVRLRFENQPKQNFQWESA